MPRPSRGVAQPGSASHWGCGGRWFESSRPDQHSFNLESPNPSMSNPPMLMTMIQAAPGGGAGSTAGLVMGIAPWLLIFVIFYVLMIRPQQQRVKQHQAEIAAVKKGDEVIPGGGIRGRVTKVNDDEVEVEIAQNVRIRVVKSTISNVLSPGSKPAND